MASYIARAEYHIVVGNVADEEEAWAFITETIEEGVIDWDDITWRLEPIEDENRTIAREIAERDV